jgi:hypothetical protein
MTHALEVAAILAEHAFGHKGQVLQDMERLVVSFGGVRRSGEAQHRPEAVVDLAHDSRAERSELLS